LTIAEPDEKAIIVRCARCDWNREGTLAECREAHRAHRKHEHGAEILAFATAREGHGRGRILDGVKKGPTAQATRVLGILKSRGEMTTSEISLMLGISAVSGGVVLGHMQRRGEIEKRDTCGHRFWRIAGTESTRTV
jgi:hypothetical protein